MKMFLMRDFTHIFQYEPKILSVALLHGIQVTDYKTCQGDLGVMFK